jgi:hypothetical protein
MSGVAALYIHAVPLKYGYDYSSGTGTLVRLMIVQDAKFDMPNWAKDKYWCNQLILIDAN